MSLRARLTVTTLLVAGLGLVIAGVATFGLMRSFLLDRVDQQLLAAREPAIGLLRAGSFQLIGGRLDASRSPVPAGTWAILLSDDGSERASFVFTFADEQPPPPVLPDLTALSGSTTFSTSGPDGSRYRVLAEPVIGGGALVIAIPLTEVSETLRSLVRIELIVAALALIAAGAIAWTTTRVGLRPLADMEATAGAIAAGDLSQRVGTADPRTEVGRLGLALNGMLGRLEEAFSAKTASEERLRRFVADASHELRTPLTSVRGYAELFRHGAADDPERLADAMARIESESVRMSDLIDELLLLARMDQGPPRERERVSFDRLVRQSVEAARRLLPRRAISVTTASVILDGDAEELRRMADNLVMNACLHTPPDTEIEVSVEATDGSVTLLVADRGPGIDDDDADRIFERFYRADASRARADGGSGLGLSIVDAVARAHGGTAAYRPRAGGGSEFIVTLPLAD